MNKLLVVGCCGLLALSARAVRTVSVESLQGRQATVAFGPASGGETNALVMAWGDADGGSSPEGWANRRFAAMILPGETQKDVPLPENWGQEGATKLRFFACDGYAPEAYVTDGLINRWDAIDNAGTGTHDPAATVWKDLAGALDMTLTANGSWLDGKALKVNGPSAAGTGPTAAYKTIEVVCCGTEAKSQGMVVFSSGVGEDSLTRGVINHFGRLQLNAEKALGVPFDFDSSVKFFAGTYDGDTVTTLFADGLECRAVTFFKEGWGNPQKIVQVGCRNSGETGYRWKGDLYTVRLYSRKLTSVEIANNHLRDMVRFFGFKNVTTATAATPLVTHVRSVRVLGLTHDGKGKPSGVRLAFAGLTGPSELYMAWDASDKGSELSAWGNKKLVRVLLPVIEERTVALPSGWGSTAKAVRFFLKDGFAVPAGDYAVAGSLVHSWDARNNTGAGTYDPTAMVWKDLAGTNDLTLAAQGSWDANVPALNVNAASASSETPCTSFLSLEAVFRQTNPLSSILFYSGLQTQEGNKANVNRAVFVDQIGRIAYLDGGMETRYGLLTTKLGEIAAVGGTFQSVFTTESIVVNGDRTQLGCHANLWGQGTVVRTVIGERNLDQTSAAFYGQAYAIRLHSGRLTEAQFLDNYRRDLARYMGYAAKTDPAVASVSAAVTETGASPVPSVKPVTAEIAQSDLFRVDLRTGVREVIRQKEILPLACSSAFLDPIQVAYVTDGITGWFDGIDNAGTGVHDPNARTWKDLAGSRTMTLLDGGSWSDRALVCNGAAAYCNHDTPAYRTIEIAYKVAKTGGRILWTAGWKSRFFIMDWSGTAEREYFDGAKATVRIDRTFDANAFCSAAAIYDQDNGSGKVTALYKDGQRVENPTSHNNTWGNSVKDWMTVGGRLKTEDLNTTDNPWYGDVYAIRYYNRELTAAELAHNRLVDYLRFAGAEPRIALLPKDMTARIKLVRLEGEGDDITVWQPVAGSERTMLPDAKGEVAWSVEKGAWRLTLEIVCDGEVVQTESSLFDLRNLKPDGMVFLLR